MFVKIIFYFIILFSEDKGQPDTEVAERRKGSPSRTSFHYTYSGRGPDTGCQKTGGERKSSAEQYCNNGKRTGVSVQCGMSVFK